MLRADQDIEAYALRTGRLAPHAAAILQPFFTPLGFDVATKVRVRVMPDWFGTFGLRGSPAAAGVFGTTLDVAVETSADNGATDTWRSIGSFTQATSTTTQRKSFAGCDRFIRASPTIGGTTPSFTFSVTGEAC